MKVLVDLINLGQVKELYRMVRVNNDIIQVNLLDSKGMALIHYAAKFGTVELMQIILNLEGV
jgi:hypothetical protein